MERLKKSLHTKSLKKDKTKDFDHELAQAQENHNFFSVTQLQFSIPHLSDNKKKNIRKVIMEIQQYYLDQIYTTQSLKDLENIHIKILENTDIIGDTNEYRVLSLALQDRWYEISAN